MNSTEKRMDKLNLWKMKKSLLRSGLQDLALKT